MNGSRSHQTVLYFSCEHAGNLIPKEYRSLFKGCRQILNSHRGYDPGAMYMAHCFATAWETTFHFSEYSRLLCDLNRRVGHPTLFSEWTRSLSPIEQAQIIKKYHEPHRLVVRREIDTLIHKGTCVIHIGIHSFTPELNGMVRTADIGLLYDPSRWHEKALYHQWAIQMKAIFKENTKFEGLRIRKNYPYTGISDSLPTALRHQYTEDTYLGLELEVNQGLFNHACKNGQFPYRPFASGSPYWKQLTSLLIESLRETMAQWRNRD
jgi:predicted N-formylglutamate amidohydrolase